MAGFVKIYQTILDSSIWAEDHAVRIVWVTMLAMADQFGKVEASRGGLARRSQVTDMELDRALAVLSSPDPDDKSKVNEGRRIEEVERGWFIANHAYYRDLRTDQQIKTAERVRKFREKATVTCTDVTHGNDVKRPVRTDQKQIRSEAETDQKEEEKNPPNPPRGEVVEVFDFWRANTGHLKALLTGDRKRRIEARLKEGATVAELKTAIRNRANSPFHMGDNPQGTVWDGIEVLLKNRAQVEKFMALSAPTRPRAPVNAATQREQAKVIEIQELQRGQSAIETTGVDAFLGLPARG